MAFNSHSNTIPRSSSSPTNMFSKLSVAVTSVLITLVAAIHTTTPPVTPPTSVQCCNSAVSSTSAAASAVLGLLA
ncbi:hypothetical protein DFH09DRAFT_1305154 [Mycena vulgaris]|nr:hypothetical protein DFH09DRAFT_1305154 [Mycena vulgaris]